MSAECPDPPPPRHGPATAGPAGGSLLAPVLPLIPRTRGPAPGRPLPDAVAVVSPLSLPRTAPHYDDHPAGTRTRAPGRPPRAAGPAARTSPPQPAPPPTVPPPTAAPPHGWPHHFAQVLAETLSGARPPRQITPWTTGQARRHIERLGPALALAATPQVRRLVTFLPCADVMEMTVVLGVGPRTRALAVRLERDRLRAAPPHVPGPAWRCTAVEAA